jgi:hypothetical protein
MCAWRIVRHSHNFANYKLNLSAVFYIDGVALCEVQGYHSGKRYRLRSSSVWLSLGDWYPARRFDTSLLLHLQGWKCLYRVSQEECAGLRKGVPYVKVYRYTPKHVCPKLNGYGDNGQRKVWSSGGSTHCTCQLTVLSMSARECGVILRQFISRLP